jgi:(1->4)-alpha-D-glucan 1-alpha-D-glucosylmutase
VHGARAAVVVVPRLATKLVPGADRPPLGPDVWGDTAVALPPGVPVGAYRNAFTGEHVELSSVPLSAGELLGAFPTAVLVCEAPGAA